MPENKEPSARAKKDAERRAWHKAQRNEWQAKVQAHFGFLESEYGFRVASVEEHGWWLIRVIYQSATTAVYVDRNVEFNRVEVSLARLVNGKPPEITVFVTPNVTLNQFLLDNLLRLRAPLVQDEYLTLAGLNDEQIETSLAFLAAAVKEDAADVLHGDFTVFAALEAVVKERARQSPPQITLHTTLETPAEQTEKLVASLQSHYPDVPVGVQKYVRPVKRPRASKKAKQTDATEAAPDQRPDADTNQS